MAKGGYLVVVFVLLSVILSGCRTAPKPVTPLPAPPLSQFSHPIPKMEFDLPQQPSPPQTRNTEVRITLFKVEVNAAPQRGNVVVGAQWAPGSY